MTDEQLINDIEQVRSANNKLWLSIIRVGLQCAPAQAKAILRDINANDKKISELVEKLANE